MSHALRWFILAAVLVPAARHARAADGDLPVPLNRKEHEIGKGDDELTKLLKQRSNTALREAQYRYRIFQAGKATLDDLEPACRRLLVS